MRVWGLVRAVEDACMEEDLSVGCMLVITDKRKLWDVMKNSHEISRLISGG